MIGRTILCLTMLALSACSTTPGMDEAFRTAIARGADKAVPRAQALYDAGAPRMVIGIPKTGKNGIMVLEARRDGLKTWLSADGVAVILDHGMLRGTRGLGAGLLASDIAQSSALVRSRREGRAQRFHTFLTGTDAAVTRSYECRIESRGERTVDLDRRKVATRLFAEHCHNTDQEFVNLYWIADSDGRIVQSRQWTGDELGDVSFRVVESPA